MPVKVKKITDKKPFKKWYDDNKKDFNEQRRDRYRTDPEYRKRVQENNAKNSNRKKKNLPTMDEYESVPLEMEGGIILECYSIKDACEIIGRGKQTIRLWTKNKDIPDVSVVDEEGIKYYTDTQINLLIDFADIRRGLSGATINANADLAKASKIVFTNWEK